MGVGSNSSNRWWARGDLVEVGELDGVAVEDVNVVEAEAVEALVDAAGDAGGAEVEPFPVAPTLGGDHEPVPRHARGAEAVPEHRLRHRAAVVPAMRLTLRSGESRGEEEVEVVVRTGRCRRS